MEKYYSTKEAAITYSISEKTLKDWLRNGNLKGEKVGRAWRVADSELRGYLKRDPVIDKEGIIINDLYVQSELKKVQQLLFDVDNGKRDGMNGGNALALAGQLEDVIDYLEERRNGAKYSRHDFSGNARFIRSRPGTEPTVSLDNYIEVIIDNLMDFNDHELEVVDQVIEIKEALTKHYGDGLPVAIRKPLIHLDRLIEKAKNYVKRDQNEGVSLGDALRLAAEFRYLSEYVDKGIIENIKI